MLFGLGAPSLLLLLRCALLIRCLGVAQDDGTVREDGRVKCRSEIVFEWEASFGDVVGKQTVHAKCEKF